MTKEEFIEHWKFQSAIGYGRACIDCGEQLSNELEQVIAQAIAENEQKQWKAYPENKPDKSEWYHVTSIRPDGTKDVQDVYYFLKSNKWSLNDGSVIAFRELPTAYQKEEGDEG